jgi:hypothetical protein
MEHYISKKLFNFEISFYTFKVATTKHFMKIHHVSKMFLYV